MNRTVIVILSLILNACSSKKDEKIIEERLPQSNQTYLKPYLVAISTSEASLFSQPEKTFDWLMNNKPTRVAFGQVNAFKIAGRNFAVTAPHTIVSLGRLHPWPLIKSIGQWNNSSDGLEISFAELTDWNAAGFEVEPIELAKPVENVMAVIKSSVLLPNKEIKHVEIEGMLSFIHDPTDLHTLGQIMSKDSSVAKRLLERAPKEPLIVMGISPEQQGYLQGSSGALVWQNGHPVGLFVAAIFNPERPPLGLIEPLMNAAQKISDK